MRRSAGGLTEKGADGKPFAPSSLKRAVFAPLAVALLFGFTLCRPVPRAAEPRVVPLRTPAPLDAAAEDFLEDLEHRTFRWFWDVADPVTGLVPDLAPTPTFSSVAAVGFGLTAYTIGAERGWVSRTEAAGRAGRTLRFLLEAPQSGRAADVTGYRGFFYHFLDMKTGRRFKTVELSTIDTALLAAGALSCMSYFDRDDPIEAQVRADADALYRRIEWDWARPRPPGVAMGWTPEEGFHSWNWHGYNEGMILYVLALGSPTHPVDPTAWEEFTRTYRWGECFGQEYVACAPLFVHQYSHVWLDFRDIRDAYMRGKGIDYFENSRRATYAHRAYAIRNPNGWMGYGKDVWGLTACYGPLDGDLEVGGRRRHFFTYAARGVSMEEVRDDGTIAPTAAAGSIPFAPEIAIPALREMKRQWEKDLWNDFGFLDAFNPTLKDPGVPVQHGRIAAGVGWFERDQLGIDQGPIVAMIENYRTELVWKTMRRNPYIVAGLQRAGFTGGWLRGERKATGLLLAPLGEGTFARPLFALLSAP